MSTPTMPASPRRVGHLVDHGHRRIALLNGPEPRAYASERLRGFREALAARRLEADPRLVLHGDTSAAFGRAATESLLALDRPPTAIVCCNSLAAAGACEALRAAGRSIPDDMSLVAHDDLLPHAEPLAFSPPLTVTQLALEDAADHIVRLLLARINGEPVEALHVEQGAALVTRGSVKPPGPRKA
jgi:LacI family transcriptional regulator